MDIDKHRNREIERYGLTKADRSYTFYHDETNNARKLYIAAGRLNVAELKVFVLGGVVHPGPPTPIDIGTLRGMMRIQLSATEITLALVAKGSFLDLLKSEKLTIFLRWLADSGLMIHYHALDPLYWSTVDIIDSIVPHMGDPMVAEYHALLKSDLTAVLREELATTVQIFHAFGYPGLSPEARKPFRETLVDLTDRSLALEATNTFMLRNLLRAGRALPSLDLIEGNPSNLLIDEFGTFYAARIAIFKYANHVLDMEDVIRDHLLETPLTSHGAPVTNFRFADSKAEPGIQISDVVVGILGKMFTYFTNTEHDDVVADRDALDDRSLENADLLRDLISLSHDDNIAFINHVASVHDVNKLDLFLRFVDGAYAA